MSFFVVSDHSDSSLSNIFDSWRKISCSPFVIPKKAVIVLWSNDDVSSSSGGRWRAGVSRRTRHPGRISSVAMQPIPFPMTSSSTYITSHCWWCPGAHSCFSPSAQICLSCCPFPIRRLKSFLCWRRPQLIGLTFIKQRSWLLEEVPQTFPLPWCLRRSRFLLTTPTVAQVSEILSWTGRNLLLTSHINMFIVVNSSKVLSFILPLECRSLWSLLRVLGLLLRSHTEEFQSQSDAALSSRTGQAPRLNIQMEKTYIFQEQVQPEL